MRIVDPELRERLCQLATERYESEDVEVDGDPAIVVMERGVWLQAWVWVGFDEAESVGSANVVRCSRCGADTAAKEAHRHTDAWIGECCWDDRLRTTEWARASGLLKAREVQFAWQCSLASWPSARGS